MKQSVRFLFTLVLCFVLSISGVLVGAATARAADTGVWTQLPVYGGTVFSLVVDPVSPSTLYAGTDGGGVLRSTDSGATWTAANTGLLNTRVRSLAIDPLSPSTLYAGTDGDGVFRSTNSGTSWTAATTGLTSHSVGRLAINPLAPITLYAGTSGDGIFRSTDGGVTWTPVPNDVSLSNIWALTIDPTAPSTLYASSQGQGVFRSTDSGATWTAMNNGLTEWYVSSLVINPLTPAILYAGCAAWDGPRGGIFRSTDSGATWTAVNTGLTNTDVCRLAIDPLTPSTLYAGTDRGVFYSTDSGSTWTAMNNGLPKYGGVSSLSIMSLAVDPLTPSTVYAGTGRDGRMAGVFRYDTASSHSLTTTASPSGSGTIGRSPDAASYVPGTVVTITATPASGYVFAGWSGDLSNTMNPITVMLTGNKTVTATFTAIPTYTVTPSASLWGTITPNTVQTVLQGGSTTFAIVPTAGYDIADVSVDGVSHGIVSSYTFSNVTSNHAIRATFEQEKKQTVIVLQIGNSMFTVNGGSKGLDSPPVIKNGRTLVPIRAIIEALGGAVGWDGTARKATVTLGSATIELWIGKNAATVNGVTTPIDATNAKVVPEIITSRTMLPLRFVSENLGCSVGWVDATKTITITYQP